MDARGIAPLVVAVIVVAVGAAATPVTVDTIDVDPDHPLYPLEKIGERMKGAVGLVKDVDLMKERYAEFGRMCTKGKGSMYASVAREADNLADRCLRGARRAEVAEWLKAKEMEVLGRKLELLQEILPKLENQMTLYRAELEALLEFVQQVRTELEAGTLTPEQLEEKIEYIHGELENLAAQKREWMEALRATENFRVKVWCARAVTEHFNVEELIAKYQSLLSAVQAKLSTAPLRAGGVAGRVLCERAQELYARATAGAEENYIVAGELYAAVVLLQRAENILDHATAWQQQIKKRVEELRAFPKRGG
jgi:hypothetical protein